MTTFRTGRSGGLDVRPTWSGEGPVLRSVRVLELYVTGAWPGCTYSPRRSTERMAPEHHLADPAARRGGVSPSPLAELNRGRPTRSGRTCRTSVRGCRRTSGPAPPRRAGCSPRTATVGQTEPCPLGPTDHGADTARHGRHPRPAHTRWTAGPVRAPGGPGRPLDRPLQNGPRGKGREHVHPGRPGRPTLYDPVSAVRDWLSCLHRRASTNPHWEVISYGGDEWAVAHRRDR